MVSDTITEINIIVILDYYHNQYYFFQNSWEKSIILIEILPKIILDKRINIFISKGDFNDHSQKYC